MNEHKFFKALGDKTRFEIVSILLKNKNNCCSDLAETTKKDISTITRQLKILKQENIITINKKGKKKCISLVDKKRIEKIISEIKNFKKIK